MTDSMRLDRRRLLRAAVASAAALAVPRWPLAQAPRQRFVAPPFALGVASGYPLADGVSLWTRIAPLPHLPGGGLLPDEWVDVTWQVAEDAQFRTLAAHGRRRAVPETAWSVHVDVAGLRPGREYHYRFIAGDEVSAVGRTRTAPAGGRGADRVRLGFASCQHFEQGWFEAYRHLIDDAPDLMLFLGDYIYESTWGEDLVRRHVGGECYTLDDYRVRHAQYKTDPDLQRAHAAMPWLVVWDDHEIDNDPAGDVSEHLDPRFLLRRAAAYQAYWEHMPLPQRMRPRVDGSMPIHGEVAWGEALRLFLLDDRQYRSPNACADPFKGAGSTDVVAAACAELDDPSRTLLGEAQAAWLDGALAASRARWNLIAQQTLVSPLARTTIDDQPTVWTDGWAGFPASRERLLRALARPDLGNPLVLGGDLHCNLVANLRRDPRDPDSAIVAAEVCGTSLVSQGREQARYDAVRAHNPHLLLARSDRRGYGLVTIDREATIELRVLDSEKQRGSRIQTLARFVVEDGRRGLVAG